MAQLSVGGPSESLKTCIGSLGARLAEETDLRPKPNGDGGWINVES